MLREFLHTAQRDGSLPHLMSELLNANASEPVSEFEVVGSHGAMTDGSKRRKESPPPFSEDESFTSELVPGSEQMPVRPNRIKAAEDYGSDLPEGISDVKMWGKTLLQVGKWASANLSYEEFYVSQDKEHQRYVSWLKNQKNRTDLGSPMIDLIRFVLVRSGVPTTQGSHFEGSSTRRQFKK